MEIEDEHGILVENCNVGTAGLQVILDHLFGQSKRIALKMRGGLKLVSVIVGPTNLLRCTVGSGHGIHRAIPLL
jgi:hypothetical protein